MRIRNLPLKTVSRKVHEAAGRMALIFLITFLLTSLILYISPPPKTLAQTIPTNCGAGPTTYNPNNPNKVQIQDGFLSVTSSNIINQMSLMNAADKYICGYQAIIPQFAIPSYQEFKNTYYDQARTSVANKQVLTPSPGQPFQQNSPGTINLTDNSTSPKAFLYNVKGDLVLNSDFTGNQTGIFFIDGNLTINSNLDYPNGLVFIAQGYVHINSDVTHDSSYSMHPSTTGTYPPPGDKNYMQINALIMSYGQFCSGWSSEGCNIDYFKNRLASYPDNPLLVVNGSVVALSATNANQPLFVRYIRNNIIPAEEVNFQAKYLVILRKIFSRTRIIYTQINWEITYRSFFVVFGTK